MFAKLLTEAFPGFLSIRNERHEIIYLNDNFRNWIKEYTDIDPIGKTNIQIAELVPKNVADTFLQCHDGSVELYNLEDKKQGLKKTIEFKGKDENIENSRFFDVFKFIVNVDDKPYIYTIAYDITDIYKENLENLHSSITDSLTNVYNRRFLEMKYSQFIGHFAILIDLDNFKYVNDTFGHDAGDEVLRTFSKLLTNIEKNIATIRLGGDEFLCIVSLDVTKQQLEEALVKFRAYFERKFAKYEKLSFSCGFQRLESNMHTSLKMLDKKLYKNKYMRKQ